MAGLDNKISNIIGTKLPQWLLSQIQTRSINGARDSRDNSNILYLTNKSAWVRLVSSIDLVNQSDLNYFSRIVGDSITSKSDLAKQFVLFGGTSKYLDKNSYQLRSGIGAGGAYGTLGKDEIQRYGYKPMPGITNVGIETQGRLGSVRAATINFKCWDKAQLDIMDALYFKLGFTMFLEWGNTAFYTSEDRNRLQSSELYSIDPFQADLSKEEICIQVAKNSRQSEGNYDGMLGIVTNFSFTYTQDGGFDCQVRLMALGVLADSLKINNVGTLPGIVEDEIRQLTSTLAQISAALNNPATETPRPDFEEYNDILSNLVSDLALFIPNTRKLFSDLSPEVKKTIAFANNNVDSERAKKTLRSELSKNGNDIVVFPYTTNFTIDDLNLYNSIPDKNFYRLDYAVDRSSRYYISGLNLILDKNKSYSDITLDIFELKKRYLESNKNDLVDTLGFFQDVFNREKEIKNRQININEVQKYEYSLFYNNSLGKQYYFRVTIPGYIGNATLGDPAIRRDLLETIFKDGESLFSDPRLSFSKEYFNQTKNWSHFTYTFNLVFKVKATDPVTNEEIDLDINIDFNDSSLFQNIKPDNQNLFLTPFGVSLKERNQIAQNVNEFTTESELSEKKKALDTQVREAVNSQSALELTLRAIQLHALNRAITSKGLDVGKSVFTLKMADANEKKFLNQIFSNGLFSDFLDQLTSGNIPINAYNDNTKSLSRLQRLKIQSKYGFATSLMGNSADISTLSNCKFKDLLRAFVVPYQINQEIIKGTSTNHPVYIPLGLLLMILNHSCTIYDSKESDKTQTPLIYIDFNTEHNYFLSNTKQLSTNPWVTLIPFEGSFNDYKKLFDTNILDGNDIKPPSGSQESAPLFNPETQDVLSGQIPAIKFDGTGNNIYRGKLMNILLNIDYLARIVKDYSYKDGTNSIYLKEFIEQILTDLNKYLGKINVFRLSYNDKGNTLQIIDDQFIPVKDEEDQIGPNDVKTTGTILATSNTTELPLIGKYSIAKTLDIKSEVSSKLANTLAISANADVGSKASLSKNGDNYGYINTSYQDRYIVNRLEIKNTNTGSKTDVNLDSIINSALQFNQTISDFYSKINPSETTVDHATNYFIDKMTKIKNNEYPTRASAMIPVSINFSTDGISGFLMGQAFTIPDELLPYTYNARNVINTDAKGLKADHINKVGFVVVGLNHSLENNQWTTNVRANMIFLKDKTEFSGSVVQTDNRSGLFTENENREFIVGGASALKTVTDIPWSAAFISYVMQKAGVDFPSNAAHVGYLNSLKGQGQASNFELLDPAKNKVQVGDLVVFNRDGNNQTFSSIPYSGNSHGDIIVSVSGISADGIGGNVSDKVSKTVFTLSNGRIINRDVFVIARPKTKASEIADAAKYEYNLWLSNGWKEYSSAAIPTLSEYYKIVNINIT